MLTSSPDDHETGRELDALARSVIIAGLEDRGVDSTTAASWVDSGDLPTYFNDLDLLRPPYLTIDDIAARTGVSIERISRIWLNAGMPIPEREDPAFYEADVDLVDALGSMSGLFEEETVLAMLRVIGASLARIAGASETAFVIATERAGFERESTDPAFAGFAAQALHRFQLMNSVLGTLLAHHLRIVLERGKVARDATTHWETGAWAVGFVDLAGYTSMSESLSPSELIELVRSFERISHEVVTSHRATLVKLIGDEAMFAATDPAQACEIAQALLDQLATLSSLAVPRAGLAFGEVVTKDGDFHGPVVNLAARACDIAVPDEILVADLLVHALSNDARFHFEPAGRRSLKGFTHPQPLWTLSP